ncbi:hypothetical protein Bca4012_020363 [Brassica carinata]|uniref:Uncharacterized protein n=1 Tax=Brassica carinata TaxID=52824 RepID=A0A8X7WI73_BRACI|nr:hypothetical protein Bca52824_001261 [Brassica carinata]
MVVMTSVTMVVATPVKTNLRSDGGGDERWGTGEMAMLVVVRNDGGGGGDERPSLLLLSLRTPSLLSLLLL